MDPNAVAGMIFTLLLAIVVGGFIVLFPLTRRLGALIESRIDRKLPAPVATQDVAALHEAIAAVAADVQRIAERQEFVEMLLAKRADPALTQRLTAQLEAAQRADPAQDRE